MSIHAAAARTLLISLLALAACYSASPDETADAPEATPQDLVNKTPTKSVPCSDCLNAQFQCEVDCFGDKQCMLGCVGASDACYEHCTPDDEGGGWIRHPCAGISGADPDICAFWFDLQKD